MIGSLGQPILFLLALGFGLGPTFARAGRGDYVQFLAPSIVTMPPWIGATVAAPSVRPSTRPAGLPPPPGSGRRSRYCCRLRCCSWR